MTKETSITPKRSYLIKPWQMLGAIVAAVGFGAGILITHKNNLELSTDSGPKMPDGGEQLPSSALSKAIGTPASKEQDLEILLNFPRLKHQFIDNSLNRLGTRNLEIIQKRYLQNLEGKNGKIKQLIAKCSDSEKLELEVISHQLIPSGAGMSSFNPSTKHYGACFTDQNAPESALEQIVDHELTHICLHIINRNSLPCPYNNQLEQQRFEAALAPLEESLAPIKKRIYQITRLNDKTSHPLDKNLYKMAKRAKKIPNWLRVDKVAFDQLKEGDIYGREYTIKEKWPQDDEEQADYFVRIEPPNELTHLAALISNYEYHIKPYLTDYLKDPTNQQAKKLLHAEQVAYIVEFLEPLLIQNQALKLHLQNVIGNYLNNQQLKTQTIDR